MALVASNDRIIESEKQVNDLKVALEGSRDRIMELEGLYQNQLSHSKSLEATVNQLKDEVIALKLSGEELILASKKKENALLSEISTMNTTAAASGGISQRVYLDEVLNLYEEVWLSIKTLFRKTSFATSHAMKDLVQLVVEDAQKDVMNRIDTIKDLIFTKDRDSVPQEVSVHNFVDAYLQLNIEKISRDISRNILIHAFPLNFDASNLAASQYRSLQAISQCYRVLQGVPMDKATLRWLENFNNKMYDVLEELVQSLVRLGCKLAVVKPAAELSFNFDINEYVEVTKVKYDNNGFEQRVLLFPGLYVRGDEKLRSLVKVMHIQRQQM
ncbi:hypothetical protein HDU97_001788 [Phlyctochytrium planicorne]|nr:hypothetical protein HDU97_001788 [Phlyctochytrium planicorne]